MCVCVCVCVCARARERVCMCLDFQSVNSAVYTQNGLYNGMNNHNFCRSNVNIYSAKQLPEHIFHV